jgi:uncharacterized protein
MAWYLYRLLMPRPDFASTMSEHEQAVMREHVAYWTGHLEDGRVLVFSPVADPDGDWGMAVVEADAMAEVEALGDDDPAVTTNVAGYDVVELPGAVVAS